MTGRPFVGAPSLPRLCLIRAQTAHFYVAGRKRRRPRERQSRRSRARGTNLKYANVSANLARPAQLPSNCRRVSCNAAFLLGKRPPGKFVPSADILYARDGRKRSKVSPSVTVGRSSPLTARPRTRASLTSRINEAKGSLASVRLPFLYRRSKLASIHRRVNEWR